ncbi:CHAT domain-containing protein [Streptomyces sp. CBMA123]|uniref:CHAT domain-containing protein n=1 Tax=Streptomyces sp. CBMA123 TaxID=1896313 RepID=UPI001661D2AF|nr:CHAT domain-containing protein [Streptomyces sp. CBMA123]MBD0695801.1 hypothetical protein [Streptomyces sp. CBMA123]
MSDIHAEITPTRLTEGRIAELVVRLTNDGEGVCTDIVFVLSLPPQLSLLAGGSRMELAELAPGAGVDHRIQVRSSKPGAWTATSRNFSYRDRASRPVRIPDFAVTLEVLPSSALPEPEKPKLAVEVTTTNLPWNEATVIRGRVANRGTVAVQTLEVALGGPFRVETRGSTGTLGELPPGASTEFLFYAKALDRGTAVPLHVELDYADRHGRSFHVAHTVAVGVSSAPLHRPRPPRLKILHLEALPDRHRQSSRLDHEVRAIREEIRLSGHRESIEVESERAVRARDITRALLRERPRIVHFSGYGDPNGNYLVETDDGGVHPLPPASLAGLFAAAGHGTECVILNSCGSDATAEAVVEHIGHVIGMREEIGESSAIAFSVGFYQALAAGCTIAEAFELGCVQIAMTASRPAEHLVPVLWIRANKR